MLNIQQLLPYVKQAFPSATEDVLIKNLTEFVKQNPTMNMQQALQVLAGVVKHPEVQKAMAKHSKSLNGYLSKNSQQGK